jgi:uncharacterized protein YndB with AHSA1/START domain
MSAKSSEPFVISRVLDAPRDKVWKAWTEAERLKKWWGPAGFTVHTCKVDLRPGGVFHYGMKAPDGSDMWGKFVYREIKAPQRLVFIVSFSDEKGGVTRHPWSANWPLETFSTVTFEEIPGGKTKVSVQWIPAESSTDIERKTFDEGREGMKQGWGGTMDQFAAYLAKGERMSDTLTLTRLYNAPRERVWKAWTDPEQVAQWWGPNGFTTPRCELDVRPAGMLRIDMRAPDGKVLPLTGVYREVVAPERLVFLCSALDENGALIFEVLNTITFAKQGGKTKLTVQTQVLRKTPGAAEGQVEGWTQTLVRLEEFLENKQRKK